MKYKKLEIPDIVLIEPDIFRDERGFFLETWKKNFFSDITEGNYEFVQDNSSRSNRNVLRGLHYQVNKPQGKLVRVSRGSILDVVIDLRESSKFFKKSLCVEISEYNQRILWVPPGFAHGFCATSEITDLHYKCTDYFDANDEYGINPLDPFLNIAWPTKVPIISKKDKSLPKLDEIDKKKLPNLENL